MNNPALNPNTEHTGGVPWTCEGAMAWTALRMEGVTDLVRRLEAMGITDKASLAAHFSHQDDKSSQET